MWHEITNPNWIRDSSRASTQRFSATRGMRRAAYCAPRQRPRNRISRRHRPEQGATRADTPLARHDRRPDCAKPAAATLRRFPYRPIARCASLRPHPRPVRCCSPCRPRSRRPPPRRPPITLRAGDGRSRLDRPAGRAGVVGMGRRSACTTRSSARARRSATSTSNPSTAAPRRSSTAPRAPTLDAAQPEFDAQRTRMAFVRNGDVFVRDLRSGALTQVTRSDAAEVAAAVEPRRQPRVPRRQRLVPVARRPAA